MTKILPLWMLPWLFLQATRTFSRTSCMEYILRKGGWVRAHGFFLITFFKKGNSLVQRKENFRWNHITCLFNWLRLRNYIHRENVDTHIHSVHLTYKLSFNIQSPNIYLTLSEVAWEDTLATSELELQGIWNSGKLESLAIFCALFICKAVTMAGS